MASRRLSIRRAVSVLVVGAILSTFSLPVTAQVPTLMESKAPGSSAGEPISPVRSIAPPVDPIAAAAYSVLEKHCARCHQGGRLRLAAPAGDFGNILRLDELSTLPHLVQPGNPDASRLYTMMLRRSMPPDAYGAGALEPAPMSQEAAAVRTWISGLPPSTACRDRRVIATADQAAALVQVASARGENPAKLRFLSIAHLHNGCVGREALAAYRQAIVRLFRGLSTKAAAVGVVPIDSARTIFKVNLDVLGWTPERWERIVQAGGDPQGLAQLLPAEILRPFGTPTPIVGADWFAATLLTAPFDHDVRQPPGSEPNMLDGVDAVVALANEHRRPLGAARAAAELGALPDDLMKLADRGDGRASVLARRLIQGLVARPEFNSRSRELLAGLGQTQQKSSSEPDKADGPPLGETDFRPIDPGPGIVLFSDKVRYRKGDLLNLVVRVSSNCHLTLVSVDQRGRGTVIFPSDFVGNTLLAAGQELRLPGPGAPYSFRLSETGRETIVALCNEGGSLTDGIRHDFERQRFTDLGNYAAFLEQNVFADAAKANGGAARRPEPRQSPSRRRGPPEKIEERTPPERISRTAIVLIVE